MSPFRIDIRSNCAVAEDGLKRNAEANGHYPKVHRCAPHKRKLAVVGGGPLVAHDLEELRRWDGDIWGINHTAKWLCEHGINATLFTVDPLPFVTEARSALLATACDPVLFASLSDPAIWPPVDIQTFDLIETHPDGIGGGRSSATRAPAISFYLGYLDVSFFGCEGSFTEVDHVDRNEGCSDQLIVRAGDRDYRTYLPLLIQCEEFVTLFSTFPQVYHNRSGGLLKAMLEHPDTWEVVAVSAELKGHLEEVNGKCGLYEEPYRPAA